MIGRHVLLLAWAGGVLTGCRRDREKKVEQPLDATAGSVDVVSSSAQLDQHLNKVIAIRGKLYDPDSKDESIWLELLGEDLEIVAFDRQRQGKLIGQTVEISGNLEKVTETGVNDEGLPVQARVGTWYRLQGGHLKDGTKLTRPASKPEADPFAPEGK